PPSVLLSFPTRRSSDLHQHVRRGQSDEAAANDKGDGRVGTGYQGSGNEQQASQKGNTDDAFAGAGFIAASAHQFVSNPTADRLRSEEHTSELQSPDHLV